MQNYVKLVFFLLISSNLIASELTVRQINTSKEEIAVNLDENTEVKEKDSFVLTLKNKQQCIFSIHEIKKSVAILRSDDCYENFNLIEVGDSLESSLFSTDDDDEDEEGDSQTEKYLAERNSRFDSDLPSKNERFYLQFGLGVSSFEYSTEAQAVVDELNSISGISKVGINLDLFGFYFPVNNHKTLIGGMISAAAERWSGNGGSLQINQYLFGSSVQHFFGRNIGDGFFIRGDLGVSYFDVDLDTTTLKATERSSAGLGLLLGGGYAIPISTETRLMLNLNLAYRSAGDDDSSTVNLNVGFLF